MATASVKNDRRNAAAREATARVAEGHFEAATLRLSQAQALLFCLGSNKNARIQEDAVDGINAL